MYQKHTDDFCETLNVKEPFLNKQKLLDSSKKIQNYESYDEVYKIHTSY